MRLYELTEGLETVLDGGYVIDDETGEVIFDSENLEELRLELDEKLENCGCYIKNLLAEADAVKNEERALKERRERLEKRAERMKEYVRRCMDRAGSKAIETPRVELRTRKTSRVVVSDLDELPSEYVTEKVFVSPDKVKIKRVIKAGGEVPGAFIEDATSLLVR